MLAGSQIKRRFHQPRACYNQIQRSILIETLTYESILQIPRQEV